MKTSTAQSERQELCALLEDRGPLAPTLCEGWTTADLAAHLFVREHKLLAAPGIVIGPLAPIAERAMQSAKREVGYAGLVKVLRSGPPMPLRLVDEQMNVGEFFIHHEDVRRAADEWEPRQSAALDTALWRLVRRGGRLMARRVQGAGLRLEAPGFGSVEARKGEPTAVLSGGPQELLLYLFGRKGVARVELQGSEGARSAVQSARLGL